MAKIMWISDLDFSGSGYSNISRALCDELTKLGHDIKIAGLFYKNEEHFQDYSIFAAQSVTETMAMAQNLYSEWRFNVMIVALDIPLQEHYLKPLESKPFKYVGIFPVEADPLIFEYAALLSQMDKCFVISEFGTQECRKQGIATAEHLRRMGFSLQPIELPEHADMDELQMLLVDEAAAFDELVHNGKIELFRQDIDEPEDMLMRIARLHPAVEYVQINRRRMLLMQGMARIFDKIDVLVTPFSGSPVQSATSLTGHPSVAIINGFDDSAKPTGIQFIGQLYGEADALLLAKTVQDSTDFHLRHPDISVV